MAGKRGAKSPSKRASVVFAAAFTIPTAKDVPLKEIRNLIRRVAIPLEGEIKRRLDTLANAKVESPIDVAFRSHGDRQQNPVHSLVQRLATDTKRQDAVRDLACRLAAAMDHRSQPGLLVAAVSEGSGTEVGVHLWKFPSDDGFNVADEAGDRVLKVLKDAFAAGSSLFKGARFVDKPGPTTAYWQGLVEDRQVKIADNRPSAFWTADFLDVRLRTTARQGTQAVVGALKDVLTELTDRKLQLGVGRVPLILNNWSGQQKTVAEIAELLPAATRDRFVSRLADQGYRSSTTFEVDPDVLQTAAQFQTWRFESGVVVTVPTGQSRDLIRESVDGDQLVIEIRGTAKSTLRSRA